MAIYVGIDEVKKRVKEIYAYVGKNLAKLLDVTRTVNGVTFTSNSKNGTVTVNGTSSALAYTMVNSGNIYLKAGTYVLTGCPTGANFSSTYHLRAGIKDPSGTITSGIGDVIELGNGVAFTITQEMVDAGVYVVIGPFVAKGYTASSVVFRPMIRVAEIIDATFEPYVGTKKIKSIWVNKDGVATKVYGEKQALFVACDADGELWWSADGIAWEQGNANNAGYIIRGVTYGNGLFVAVGEGGNVFYSEDGKVWTRNKVSDVYFYGVTYGNGLFIAVGKSGYIYRSSDGISWTLGGITSGGSDLRRVTYGNGLFVAVGGSSKIYYSTDGKTWAAGSGSSVTIRGVTYGNGKFVAVGNQGATYYSTNGKTWTAGNVTGSNDTLVEVGYGNGKFITSGSGGAAYYSTDGKTWTAVSVGTTAYLNSIAYGDEKYVIVGDGGVGYYSTDGNTWSPCTGMGTYNLYGVAYRIDGGSDRT